MNRLLTFRKRASAATHAGGVQGNCCGQPRRRLQRATSTGYHIDHLSRGGPAKGGAQAPPTHNLKPQNHVLRFYIGGILTERDFGKAQVSKTP